MRQKGEEVGGDVKKAQGGVKMEQQEVRVGEK